jgi:tripartite-type tricarboxylate transporter receptor subunit TctC
VRQAVTRTDYDLERDFAPISLSGVTPIVIATHPRLPAADLPSFIAWLKAQRTPVPWGSTGIGTLMHFAGEAFRAAVGVEMTHVPYRGAAPLSTDLAGGQVEIGVSGLPPLKPLADAGRIRLIAATTARRTAALPDLPTLAETGIADIDIANYVGLAAPAQTPAEIRAKLEAAAQASARLPEVKAAFERSASVPIGTSAAEYRDFIARERQRQTEIIRTTGFRIDE